MHLFFSSLSYITWSCLSFVQRDGFIPCPPLWECLMLSLMSVAGQWTWICCHGACTDRAATSPCPLLPQTPTEAFNLPLSSQHHHFSDFKRAWSAQEVQFPAFKVLQPWRNSVFPSEASSLESETCFTERELGERAPDLTSICSTVPLSALVPTSQNNLPSPSSPRSWHVKYCLVTVVQNDSNYSMNENNRALYIALMTNIKHNSLLWDFSMQAELAVCKAFAESWLGKASCGMAAAGMNAQGCWKGKKFPFTSFCWLKGQGEPHRTGAGHDIVTKQFGFLNKPQISTGL